MDAKMIWNNENNNDILLYDRTFFNLINEPNANVSSLKILMIFLVRQCRFHRFHDFIRLSKRANG